MDGALATYGWMFLPFLVAAGSGLLAAFIMQARTEVALARQREGLAETRALLATQQRALEDKVRAAEQTARREALDEFMADIRIEERHYLRESKSLFVNQRFLVLQERVYFRNIPLTNWVEHEFAVAEGSWGKALPQARTRQAAETLPRQPAGLISPHQHAAGDDEQDGSV
jgi:hypothetical protein